MKRQKFVVILLVGILLAVIAIPVSPKGDADKETQPEEALQSSNDSYEHTLEKRLENLLGEVDGVGSVKVMLTLRTSAEKVIEKDRESTSQTVEETDAQGGTRVTKDSSTGTSTVYDSGEGNTQSPYVSKEISPEIEGVIISAQGGGNAVVVKNITEAVQALFDVDTHKIKVMKMNQSK